MVMKSQFCLMDAPSQMAALVPGIQYVTCQPANFSLDLNTVQAMWGFGDLPLRSAQAHTGGYQH